MNETIQKYYHDKDINDIGLLQDDIDSNNEKVLCYIEYVINNLLSVTGIERLLEDIAKINKCDIGGERIYHNKIMELHSIVFVHRELKLKILEVESNKNRVFSPHRVKKEWSCDIKATDLTKDYFFESKDASSEITTRYVDKSGITHFTPISKGKIRDWIVQKCREANDKGANYLICRVPVWSPKLGKTEEFFYEEWIQGIFKIKQRLTKQDLIISLSHCLSEHFEGIYILKSYGYIRLKIERNRRLLQLKKLTEPLCSLIKNIWGNLMAISHIF